MLPAHTHVAKFTNPHFTGLWREHPAEGRTLAAEARPSPVAFPVTVPQHPTLLSALGIRARKHCSHPAPDDTRPRRRAALSRSASRRAAFPHVRTTRPARPAQLADAGASGPWLFSQLFSWISSVPAPTGRPDHLMSSPLLRRSGHPHPRFHSTAMTGVCSASRFANSQQGWVLRTGCPPLTPSGKKLKRRLHPSEPPRGREANAWCDSAP